MTPLRISCVAFALLGACDYFPPELVDDAGVTPDATEAFELAETCLGDVPMLTGDGLEDVFIDLNGLGDDISDIGFCTGADAPGSDGFFGVEMQAQDNWHFHLRTSREGNFNPAIYVLDSICDSRRCMNGDAIDICGEGRDEHLSFTAPATGTYFVGIDSRVTGGATYQLLALKTVCGNERIEHSETCDDGNELPGDGCDEHCRVELPRDGTSFEEVEPNDDPPGANHLLDLSQPATGRLGGRCDRDVFVFEVVSESNLEVSLGGLAGVACAEGTPLIELDLWASNGVSRVATGTSADGEFCPTLSVSGLAAGTYYVSVLTDEAERPFDYSVDVDVSE